MAQRSEQEKGKTTEHKKENKAVRCPLSGATDIGPVHFNQNGISLKEFISRNLDDNLALLM